MKTARRNLLPACKRQGRARFAMPRPPKAGGGDALRRRVVRRSGRSRRRPAAGPRWSRSAPMTAAAAPTRSPSSRRSSAPTKRTTSPPRSARRRSRRTSSPCTSRTWRGWPCCVRRKSSSRRASSSRSRSRCGRACLSYAPVTEHALKVCERTLENSIAEFKTLRKHLATLKKRHSKAEQERFERCVVKTSEKLRALDTDKRILDIVLDEHPQDHRTASRAASSTTWSSFNAEVARLQEVPARRAARRTRARTATKNEFVKANLRLVVSIARRFNYGRMPLADLIQEGNIGLIKAVERYDYRRGYRFSTYASWWIRHAISRALADKGRAVRLPVHMIDAYHRVAKSQARAVGQARPPADERGDRRGRPASRRRRSRRCARSCSISRSRSTARSATRMGASSSTSSRIRTPRTARPRTIWSTTR